jgi:small-conductance mechanosensitive channel/CRP-like cAMP-binding protein
MLSAIPAGFSPLRLAGLCAAVVVVAFLLGKLNPARRRRFRSTALLAAGYLLAVGVGIAAGIGGLGSLSHASWFASEVIELLVWSSLATLFLFDVVLHVLRVEPAGIVADLVVGVAYAIIFFHTLGRAGVNLSGIIATSAVVSGVLGLALAPTIGNILGGVALQLDSSLREGDWVRLDGTDAQVRAIRWRHTVFETFDADTLVVPNVTLLSANLRILGRKGGKRVPRRFWVYFNVSLEHPPERVIQVMEEALQGSPIPHVLPDPKPHALCYDVARENRAGFGYYAVRYWLADIAMDEPTHSLIRRRVYTAFQRAKISFAKPQENVRVVHEDEASRAAANLEEQRRRLRLLSSLDLFQGFPSPDLASLAAELTWAPYATGEQIMEQGQSAQDLFILAEGSADVLVAAGDRGAERVGGLAAPDFFGERALISGEPRAATVVAASACVCYRLDKQVFKEIVLRHKELLSNLSTVIARREGELRAAKESMSADQKREALALGRAKILRQVERFFGLDQGTVR